MLLRDERQMALSAVETLCLETADHYASAADKCGGAALARLFGELAKQRLGLAAELAVHIRAQDDLPQMPDPDREAIVQVLSGIKAFLSGDETLIDERTSAERKLIEAAQDALRQELPAALRTLLERTLAHADTALQKLADARSSRE